MLKPQSHILLYIVAAFLAIGCAKESLSPEPSDAVLALAYADNPEGPNPDPEVDCKCYMSITGAQWFGLSNITTWTLRDIPSSSVAGSVYEIFGYKDKWLHESGNYLQLPSPFWELNQPSNGWHTFEMILSPPPFESGWLELSATVKCYIQNGDGSETLATTTYHTFNWNEGSSSGTTGKRLFQKYFSCLVQTEDPPKDSETN